MGKIFSPGKLLITAEYAVLDGALALAVPTLQGQELFFDEISGGQDRIFWEAFHQEKFWLKVEIDFKNWEIISTNIPNAAAFVLKVFKNIQSLSPERFRHGCSYHFKTNLHFPPDFGLGSSSTLMANLALWAGVDAFKLNEISLGGSGYDIAVAQQKSAVLYRITEASREVQPVIWNPPFKEELIFIHLNQKQNSREGIDLYRSKKTSPELISNLSDITHKVFNCKILLEFSDLMSLHEDLLSSFLGMQIAKEKYFHDCPSFVKSLGAWGGDFVMSSKFSGWERYFSERGFSNILKSENIIG